MLKRAPRDCFVAVVLGVLARRQQSRRGDLEDPRKPQLAAAWARLNDLLATMSDMTYPWLCAHG